MHVPPDRLSDPGGSRARHAALGAVLVAALVVRLPGLRTWWLNPDEGIYYSIVTRASFAGFWDEVASNAHPPLFYLALRGLGLLTWDFVWFRVFALVCGVAAVAAAWAAARTLGGPGPRGLVAAFVAALLLALAPGAVELSQVIRPYMLQVALLSGALVFLVRYLEAARGGEAAGHSGGPAIDTASLGAYLALVLLALLTHYSSILALGAFGLVVLHDGIAHGTGRRGWRTLFLVHAVPAGLLAVVYLVHLRGLMDSALADEALDGWLDPYMVEGPASAWLAFLGFQHLLAPRWLRAATAVLVLAALVVPFLASKVRPAHAAGPDPARPAVLAGSGLLVALTAAALGVYPFGSTRHSAWLLVFIVPAVGWTVAHLLVRTPRGAAVGASAIVLLCAASGPLGRALGEPRAPWAPTDRVLREANLAQMVDLLDPEGSPELLVMGAQTFYLLLPFYPREREEATWSEDGTLSHFGLGRREVLVSEAWDFTLGEGDEGGTDLGAALSRAARAFPELELEDRAQAVFLFGGWRPPVLDHLITASAEGEPFLLGTRSVPGFYAFLVDLPAMRRALGS